MNPKLIAIAWACLCLLPVSAFSQGVLVTPRSPFPLPRADREFDSMRSPRRINPPPQSTYCIESLNVSSRIRGQLAEVQVEQTFVNTGSRTLEAQFLFPLPHDAAIDSMTLMVNGEELPAKLLDADHARRRYEDIVRRSKDPALLQWIDHGLYQTNVFPIPPGEKRTVTIQYSQLLRKDHSLIDFLFPLSTAQFTSKPVQSVSFRIAVESETPLKNLYSPSHPVNVERNGEKHAVITYETKDSIPRRDFRLFVDAQEGDIGTLLLSTRSDADEDGYFLLLASPELNHAEVPRTPKTVMLVIDRSGSMSGEKMEQARGAARSMINGLREGDLFNIIAYEAKVESFRPELERFNEETRQQALAFIESLNSGGGTNIHSALSTAFKSLQDKSRPTYVLFLTDGQPTVGNTDESEIARAVRDNNVVDARLLVFGVGYDVNSRLLDRLSRQNRGISEYVRPNENIETAVSNVVKRISFPVFTDVQLTFEVDAELHGVSQVNRVYPAGPLDLFEGQQLVVVGRYRKSGPATIRMTGQFGGKEKSFEFPAEFAPAGSPGRYQEIETLWAVRRIGEILDDIDLEGKNQELIDELVRLSTKYGILTPYTAFLADENVRPELLSAANSGMAAESLAQFDVVSGQYGFEQRSLKQEFRNASNAAEFDFAAPGFGGGSGLGGMGGGIGGIGGAAAQRRSAPSDAASPADGTSRQTVIQIGNQVAYRRGKLLLTPATASLDLEKDRSKITEIERFSSRYFDLVSRNTATENDLLSLQSEDEQLLVELRGQVYLIK